MKKVITVLTLLMFAVVTTTSAQNDNAKRPSPPMSSSAKVGNAQITIHYGSPSVKGREIWGKLVPYGEVWRTGANEATTFETDQDITVEGKALPKGKYALFTIPGKDEWTIIFNKNSQQWGAYGYKQSEDALRIKVKPAAAEHQEQLKIEVNENGTVSIHWEKVKVAFTVK